MLRAIMVPPRSIPPLFEVWQIGSENRVVDKLPDGSTAVFDTLTKTVHSINKTAAAAFEACREKRNLPQLATAMREILESPVTEETALAAISQLERAGLVACSGARPPEPGKTSRRSVLKAVGSAAAMAAPLVLSLSSAEQRAYAQGSTSGPPPSINGDDSNTVCSNIAFPQTLFIVGVNTHFSQGSSIVTFSLPWIAVTTVTVVSATGIQVAVTATPQGGSASGTFNATVVTGSETVTGVNIFFYDNTCS
jgi:hypothetical protein